MQLMLRIVMLGIFVSMVSPNAFAAKPVSCKWQPPEVRTAEANNEGEGAKAAQRAVCMKEARIAEKNRKDYTACLVRNTARIHAGGPSSDDAAMEAATFCDARISEIKRNTPACFAEYKRLDEEKLHAASWCKNDARCLDESKRAAAWFTCATAAARVHESKCHATRRVDLSQEYVDLRIKEECPPRTYQPDALALYRIYKTKPAPVKVAR